MDKVTACAIRMSQVLDGFNVLQIASSEDITAYTGLPIRWVRGALRRLCDNGRIVVDRVEKLEHGKLPLYRRPNFLLHSLAASEYTGWQPTGTPAEFAGKVSVLCAQGR